MILPPRTPSHHRRLTLAYAFDVAQDLGRGVGERRLDATHVGEPSAARVGEDRGQRELCGASCVEALWRPPRLRPRRPQAVLHLASVGQAVLDVKDVSALAFADVHMAADA